MLLKVLQKKIIRWKNYVKTRDADLTKMLLKIQIYCDVTTSRLLRLLCPEDKGTIFTIAISIIIYQSSRCNILIYANFHDIKLCSIIFDVLLTVHLSIFISVFNQLDAQNVFHSKFYFMPLHVSSTCAHHQEVKIVLYHHTYSSDDTRGFVMQF